MNQTEIKQLFNKARRILKHPGLDLLIAPTASSKGRLIIITPRYIGIAVQRNTIRRRIKAIFHENGLNKKGFDAVIIIKKEGPKIPFTQLKTIITDALENSASVRPDPSTGSDTEKSLESFPFVVSRTR